MFTEYIQWWDRHEFLFFVIVGIACGICTSVAFAKYINSRKNGS